MGRGRGGIGLVCEVERAIAKTKMKRFAPVMALYVILGERM
jgi:hypothetical protein